jgi:adenylate cyclase
MRPVPPHVEVASKEKMAFPLPDKPSIAVLPFANLSDDPKQEHFADGLTEEVINTLSRVPTLFVIASNSVFTYKGKPVKVQQVSQEMGVRYVLEGSVRRSQDRVRVTARLIDAMSGHYLWSEQYDRMLKEIFAVQDDITHNIVTALRVSLAGGEQIRIWRRTTDNVEAWEYFMRGCDLARWIKRDENAQAQELFEKAISLDPKFALGYAFLSLTHAQKARFGWSASPEQELERAFEMAQKSIALDDSLGDGHAFLGFAHMLKREFDQATAEGERAVTLIPNGATAAAMFAMTLNLVGREEEAIVLIKRAMRLSPAYPPWYLYVLGQAYRLSGRYTEAIAVFKAYRDLNPNAPFPYLHLALTYSLMDQGEEARAAINEALRLQPTYSLKQAAKAYPYKSLEVLERELGALRKAGLK